jgi:small subunit ribosomal protein S4
MGDPKFSRRKYVTPSHPWQGERIARESELIRKYGLKNKTELWRVQSLLRIFRKRARELQAKVRYGDEQAGKEMEQLLKRLEKIGLLGGEATLDDVLSLDAESLLGRRLQTMAYLKGLSYSQKQARQFIVHGHIAIGERRVTVPGYLVKREEEEGIAYLGHSPLANDLHPARPKDEMEEGEVPLPPQQDVKGEDSDKKAPEKEEKPEPGEKDEKKEEAPKDKPEPDEKEKEEALKVKEEPSENDKKEAPKAKEEPKEKAAADVKEEAPKEDKKEAPKKAVPEEGPKEPEKKKEDSS